MAWAATDAFPTTLTTAGYLSSGPDNATVVHGGAGSNLFTVYSTAASLTLTGGTGSNEFDLQSFTTVGAGNVLGGPVAEGTITINGAGGTLDVDGTDQADTFVLSNSGLAGAGMSVAYSNLKAITIDALGGNDVFDVLSTPAGAVTTLIGGGGSDTFNIGGDAPTYAGAQQTALIQGSVIVEGDDLSASYSPVRALHVAVTLPTEANPALPQPLASWVAQPDNPGLDTNTLNVINAGSTTNDTGALGDATAAAGLAKIYGVAAGSLDLTTFGLVSGINMAGSTLSSTLGHARRRHHLPRDPGHGCAAGPG